MRPASGPPVMALAAGRWGEVDLVVGSGRLTSDGYKHPQSQGALPEMPVRDLPSCEGPLMGENQPTACPWSCAPLCTQLQTRRASDAGRQNE